MPMKSRAEEPDKSTSPAGKPKGSWGDTATECHTPGFVTRHLQLHGSRIHGARCKAPRGASAQIYA